MLKHQEIIEKLTLKQKISLLTDIGRLADPEYGEAGIPRVTVRTAEKLLAGLCEGITPLTLARTWDPAIVQALIEELLRVERKEGGELLIIPAPRMKFGVYGDEMTEDPLLSEQLSRAYATAARRMGVCVAVDGFYLDRDTCQQMDVTVNRRVFMDYFLRPFRNVATQDGCAAVLGAISGPGGRYGDFNRTLAHEAESGTFGKPLRVLCRVKGHEETLEALRAGYILLSGSASALSQAYDHYQQIKKLISQGYSTTDSLDEAFAEGSAIGDEMLNAALDRVIEFAFACASVRERARLGPINEAGESRGHLNALTLGAIKRSAVLLKNGGLLPLTQRARVGLIGSAAMLARKKGSADFATLFGERLGCPVEVAEGYELAADRSEDSIPKALGVAKRADVVFVFLGQKPRDHRASNPPLPANQLALLEELSPFRDKLIGIYTADRVPDARLAQYVSTLLLTPAGAELSAQALVDLVTGRQSPCGRLSESCWHNPEETYARLRFYKNTGRNKVGAFMGYRYCESVGEETAYPFGYGMTYTRFAYSDLRVDGMHVSLRIKNEGTQPANEIVQVYLGKPDSAYARPVKELAAFTRVQLNAGEAQSLQIELDEPVIYDEKAGRYLMEGGTYTVSVGPSSHETRLTGTASVLGVDVREVREKTSDYLQSRSNILIDEYTLEAKNTQMKHYVKWMVLGGISAAAAAIVDLIILFSNMAFNLPVITVNALLLIAAGIFLIVGSRKRGAYQREEEARRAKDLKARFAELEETVYTSAEDLFAQEFDAFEEAEKEEEAEEAAQTEDTFLLIDRDLSFPLAVSEMAPFFAERGVALGNTAAAETLAAFGVSRLLYTDSLHGEVLDRFGAVLASYFDTTLFTEQVTERHVASASLLYCRNEDGQLGATELVDAIQFADAHKEKICPVLLRGMRAEWMTELLSPFVRYINNPQRLSRISVKETESIYELPKNLWFIVELAEDERIDSVSPHLCETGTMLRVDCALCEDTAPTSRGNAHTVGYYDMIYLSENSRNRAELDEDLWKKVDALEAYVNSHTSYHIGNRIWLQLETCISILGVCGNEQADSLDRAMASTLLPSMIVALKGKLGADDKTLNETVEQLFGEEHIAACRKLFSSTSTLNS